MAADDGIVDGMSESQTIRRHAASQTSQHGEARDRINIILLAVISRQFQESPKMDAK